MGIHRGPNTVNNNLVFGYDTGYGIADNNTATRFYPGEPTTNHVANPETMAGWTSYSNGNDGTFITEFGTTGYKIINRASWNGLYKAVNVPSTGTYTFSAWFRYLGGTANNNGATVYVSSYGAGDTATSLDKSKVGEWQRISKTVNFTDTDLNAIFYLISYGGSVGSDTSSWEVTMPQVEAGSGMTPFTSGTRSSTASLIDLKRTASIDVSNVSFDSTGQPDYDGTNDYLRQTLTGVDLNSGCAIEGVLRRNTTPSAWRTFFNIKPSGANTPFFEFRSNANAQHIYADYYNGSADYNTPSADLTLGDFGHAVACYDGNGIIKMYLNGSLVATKTGVPGFALGTNPVISVGIAYSNDRYTDISAPVVKVYNSPLSAAQIQQNYNAYKNRFNI